MTVGSLFAGIGGFELAATWAGFEPVWSNEIDPFCCKVLRKNFKHEIIEADIRTIGKHNLKPVDIITGGFPCPTFSLAGKGEMDLTLWKEMFRVCSELQPRWVFIENVLGLAVRESGVAIEAVCSDLEKEGYTVFPPLVIPSCGVGAWHKRDRVWIVANSFGGERGKKPHGRKTGRVGGAVQTRFVGPTLARCAARVSKSG